MIMNRIRITIFLILPYLYVFEIVQDRRCIVSYIVIFCLLAFFVALITELYLHSPTLNVNDVSIFIRRFSHEKGIEGHFVYA